MEKLGFGQLKSDSGLFVLLGAKGPEIITIVYMDDIIFMGPNVTKVNMSKDHFMQIWECQDMGDTKEFLHMRICRQGAVVILDQQDYLQKVVERFGMQNARPAPTPLPSGYAPSPNTAPVDKKLHNKYQQVIGSLLYLMIGTRPDIAYTVVKMSQFAANPSKEHFDKALYICHYLVGTADYMLDYGHTDKGFCTFADADWGADNSHQCSTSGFLVVLGGAAISWSSRA
jgi:hypothetical protein